MTTILRCAVTVSAELAADEARLREVVVDTLDEFADQAKALGWKLDGRPAAVVVDPRTAYALGLRLQVPAGHLVTVISADATDTLQPLLVRE